MMMTKRMTLILLVFSAGCSVSLKGQGDDDDVTLIKEARERSNVALANHDIEGIIAELDLNYHVTGGGGRFIEGREAMGEAFRGGFEKFPDMRYIRNVETIKLDDSDQRAFETGLWSSTWKSPEGERTTGGSYAAFWVQRSGAWKIRSELFVTLYTKPLDDESQSSLITNGARSQK